MKKKKKTTTKKKAVDPMKTVDVCTAFNANYNQEIEFTNARGIDIVLTPTSGQKWPFVDLYPFKVRARRRAYTHIKRMEDLEPGGPHHVIEASGCPSSKVGKSQKSVTVP